MQFQAQTEGLSRPDISLSLKQTTQSVRNDRRRLATPKTELK